MTPKEKAKELIETSIPHARDWKSIYGLFNAKNIALMCVSEIIKSNNNEIYIGKDISDNIECTSDSNWVYDEFMKYWIEVKHEINKTNK